MTHQTPDEPCKAQEWQRDGRGLWAMRECQATGKHARHAFSGWLCNVQPPDAAAESRVQEVERERDDLRRLKNTLQEQMEAAESRSLATEREANREHDAREAAEQRLAVLEKDRDNWKRAAYAVNALFAVLYGVHPQACQKEPQL